MFKRDWLACYEDVPEIARGECIFQSWDTASKTGPLNDWSVETTWLFKEGLYYLLDVCQEKLTYTELRAKMIEKANEFDPSVILIEDAGVGTGLIDILRHEGLNAFEVQPSQSKEIRAHIQTPKFQSSRVLFPSSAPWLSELEAEILAFPSGRNDDQVDSITQALAY